jgi:hypothetical protein
MFVVLVWSSNIRCFSGKKTRSQRIVPAIYAYHANRRQQPITFGRFIEFIGKSLDDHRPAASMLLEVLDENNCRCHSIATSSSVLSTRPGRVPKNVTDFATDDDFCSEGLPDQWIRYDFNSLRVRVTHYSLRSFDCDAGKSHPKSWVLEGCDDGEHWIELDRRSDNDQLNGRLLVATFDIKTAALCRFIRLRQTGPNHSGTNFLVISGFELFGAVVSRVL